jgi:hypothetical protein
MKTTIQVLFLMITLTPQFLKAQEITNVKTLLEENEFGNARLIVTPNTFDMNANKPTKSSGVYGLLVCYKYKGKQKAAHQDLTYDFAKKGKKVIFLGMSASKSNIIIGRTLFDRRDLMNKNEYPKKTDCFKGN